MKIIMYRLIIQFHHFCLNLEKPSDVSIYIILKILEVKVLKKLSKWNSSITIYEFQKSDFDFQFRIKTHL